MAPAAGPSPHTQVPISPPSSFVMMMVDDRGIELPPSGQWLSPASPGCWILTNMVLLSGVKVMPVTSHSLGPTRKRRISLLAGSAHSIWLLPWPSYSPELVYLPSVCIHKRPALSKARPSGLLNVLSMVMFEDPDFESSRSVYLTGFPT